MGTMKRTYQLPSETLAEFERTVSPQQRNKVIAQLVRDWLDNRKKASLRRAVIEGCREMADLYLEIEREYHPLEEEVQHALEAKSQTRRRGPRSSRSRRGV
jgi:metal-responsive CopG/Arc/MetJ family transcriptional regulator